MGKAAEAAAEGEKEEQLSCVARYLCLRDCCFDLEYKLKSIEETEAANKKLLQEKRLMAGRPKSEFNIPSSYFQRGKDYTEKLRKEHAELYKDRGPQADGQGPKPPSISSSSNNNNAADSGKSRQAATDQIMLE